MALTLSDIVVPTFIGGLNGLSNFVDRAEAHVTEHTLEPGDLLHARLRDDMFDFTQQIQAAADVARRGVLRLCEQEPPSIADEEKSFDELKARIASTLEVVKGADRAQIDAAETREFTVHMGQEMRFTGRSYVMTFALHNFSFHLVTAYDILRQQGVALGKRDYITPFVLAAGGPR